MRASVVVAILLAANAWAADLRISGSIFGPDGQAIAKAGVWCVQDEKVVHVESDASGSYAIESLQPGGVDLVAWQDGFAMGGASFRLIDDQVLNLTLGSPTTMKLRMVGSSMAPVEGARLESMVVSDAFRVDVSLLAEEGFPAPRSSADGSLAIGHLPMRSYLRFTVVHPEFASTYVAYYATGRPQQDIIMTTGIDVAGRIVDEEGGGISDARVQVTLPTVSGERRVAAPTSDPEGYFRARVRPGEIIVVADHPDYARTDAIRVRARPEMRQADATITLYPAQRLEGQIVNDDAVAFPNVSVQYLRHNELYERAVTGPDGHFLLEVLPGPGVLEIHPPTGWMPATQSSIPIRIEAGVDGDLGEIKLVPLPSVSGIVHNRLGDPEEGVFVRSLNLADPIWDLTDEQGRFTLKLRELPPSEEVQFEAEHALRFQRGRFTLDPTKVEEHDVTMRRYRPDETLVRENTVYAFAEAADDGGTNENAMTPVANLLSGLANEPAPAFACVEWFNTDGFNPADYQGKVIVLTLWAGFANMGPARARLETLNWLHERYAEEGDVAIIGIHDNGVEKEGIQKYIEAYGIEYPVGMDNEDAETFRNYRTQVIPQTFLIDRKGKIRYYDVDGRIIELVKVLRREPA